MEKLYKVTFTRKGQVYETTVEADCEHDAIEQAKEIGLGENWKAKLIAEDNEFFC